MKEMPFFSDRGDTIKDYQKFFFMRAYISQKSEEFFRGQSREKIQEVAEEIGYKKIQKFKKHLEEWNRLERKVPLKYLEIIGVQRTTLDFTLELDRAEFERARRGPFLPKKAILRLHPAFYTSYDFAEGTELEEAIEELKKVCRERHIRGFIEFWPVKTIGVRPDGSTYEAFNKPEVRFSQNYLIPEGSSRRSGRVGVK